MLYLENLKRKQQRLFTFHHFIIYTILISNKQFNFHFTSTQNQSKSSKANRQTIHFYEISKSLDSKFFLNYCLHFPKENPTARSFSGFLNTYRLHKFFSKIRKLIDRSRNKCILFNKRPRAIQ